MSTHERIKNLEARIDLFADILDHQMIQLQCGRIYNPIAQALRRMTNAGAVFVSNINALKLRRAGVTKIDDVPILGSCAMCDNDFICTEKENRNCHELNMFI